MFVGIICQNIMLKYEDMKILKALLKNKTAQPVPRSERLSVTSDQTIKLVVEKSQYPVHNISLYGLAVSLEDNEVPAIDAEIKCQLQFKDKAIDVKIKVVYANKNFMGLSVLEGKEEFNQNLNLLFKAELDGLEMRQIDPSKLNPRKAGKPYVFYGNEDHELFI